MELLLQSENTMATLLPTACSENLCVLGGWLIAVLETGQQQANDRVGCMAFPAILGNFYAVGILGLQRSAP